MTAPERAVYLLNCVGGRWEVVQIGPPDRLLSFGVMLLSERQAREWLDGQQPEPRFVVKDPPGGAPDGMVRIDKGVYMEQRRDG
jgi:hypothetical protein